MGYRNSASEMRSVAIATRSLHLMTWPRPYTARSGSVFSISAKRKRKPVRIRDRKKRTYKKDKNGNNPKNIEKPQRTVECLEGADFAQRLSVLQLGQNFRVRQNLRPVLAIDRREREEEIKGD